MLNALGLGFVFEGKDHASHVMHELEHGFERLEKGSDDHMGGVDANMREMETVFKDVTHGMGEHIHNLHGNLKVFGSGLAAAFVGFEGLEKGFEMAEAAAQSEMAMVQLQAATEATGEEMKQLEEAAIAASKATVFDDDTALKNLRLLRQAGFDTKESIDLLVPSLELATASMGELQPPEAAKGLAQTMKAYGIETRFAALAVDQMVKAQNQFGLDAASVPEALGIAERGARAMNQSMTEVLLVTGLTKPVFGSATRAAMTLGREMSGMTNPKVIASLKALGVNVVGADGDFRRFLDVVTDLEPKLKKMSKANEQAFLIKNFGEGSVMGALFDRLREGVKTTTGEILYGQKAIEYLRGTLVEAEGTSEHMAEALHDTFEGKSEIIQKIGHDLREELGMPFLHVFKPVMGLAIKILGGFLDFVRKMPMPLKVAGAAALMTLAALTALAGAALMVTVAIPILTKGLALIRLAMMGFATSTWAAIAPFIPLVAGLVVIGGLIYAIKNNVAGLGDVWNDWMNVLGVENLKTLGLVLASILIPLGAFFVIPMIAEAFGSLTAAVWALNAAFFANPITWILAGLLAIGAAIYAISTNWHGWGDDFKAGAGIIGEFLDGLGQRWNNFVADLKAGYDMIRKFISFGSDVPALGTEKKFVADQIDYGIQDQRSFHPIDSEGRVVSALPPASLDEAIRHSAPEAANAQLPGLPAELADMLAGRFAAGEGTPVGGPKGGFDYNKLADAMSKRPVQAVLNVDGEQLAEATARAERSRRARSGEPVGEE